MASRRGQETPIIVAIVALAAGTALWAGMGVAAVAPAAAVKGPSLAEFQALCIERLENDAKGERTQIFLHDHVTVAGPRVYLRDLSLCCGMRDACDELGAIDVVAAPRTSEQGRIGREQLGRILLEEERSGVEILGPMSVKVHARFMTIPAHEIVGEVEGLLTGIAPEDVSYLQARVTLTAVPEFRVYDLPRTFHFPELDALQFPTKEMYLDALSRLRRIRVQVRFPDVGDDITEFVVGCRVAVVAQALVATRVLPVGRSIEASDVTLVPVTLEPRAANLATDAFANIGGRTLNRQLGPAQPILSSYLRADILVRRNDVVHVLSRSGDFEVETSARSLDAGALGDAVFIQTVGSKRRVAARVVGRQKVVVKTVE